MYHPINKIICPPLDKLNDLARLTLEFCLTQTLALSEEEIRDSFVLHFTVNSFDKAGEWLWGKTTLVKPLVLRLIVLPTFEKQEIYTAYLQNHNLEARFAAGFFVPVPLPPVSQVAYDAAAELAGNFYKILCDGVPGKIIGETEPLNRQTVLRAYANAQRVIHLNVCPGCDGAPPSTTADGLLHEDIDHFFPKSKYPFLSIHPLNLTPYCKNCNQTYKSSKDSVLDNDPLVEDVHTLEEIYHPYERPAKNEIALEIAPAPDNSPAYRFTCVSDAAPYPARLHNLQYVLNIESRWTGELKEERVEAILSGLLLYGSQNDREGDFQPTIEWLNGQLTTAINTLDHQQGKQYLYVPALSYVRWVANDPNQKSLWLNRAQNSLF